MSEQQGAAAVPARQAEPEVILVTITPSSMPGGQPSVDKPEVFIYKTSNPKRVKWACTDPTAKFEVEFKSEWPFYENKYDDRYPESTDIRRGCQEKVPFKYQVTVNGGTPLDPNVIVEQ